LKTEKKEFKITFICNIIGFFSYELQNVTFTITWNVYVRFTFAMFDFNVYRSVNTSTDKFSNKYKPEKS